MKILITGATGFVGRHLVPSLHDKDVTLLVRNKEKAHALFGEKVKYFDLKQLSSVTKTFDIIIHLAAFLSSKDDEETMKRIIESNIIFGVQLLDTIKDYPPKLFINFGSFAQYKDGPQERNDAYLYAASKSAFEVFLQYYSKSYGFPYINVIPYTIYGDTEDNKKIIDFIRDSIEAEQPVKMSGGRQVLDFIHVNDVISFINYIITDINYFSNGSNRNYFLGTGKGTSIRELAKMIEKKYGKRCNIAWGELPYRRNDIMFACAPQGPLINCGWQPQSNLYEMI